MSERTGTPAHDPFDGRAPTSHERMTGRGWDTAYTDGPAPWDIGGPQPAVVRLASEGAFSGPVLDAGCGNGDNGLEIASTGVAVLGFDVASTAVALARTKAAELGLDAEFVTADAFDLASLGRTFRSVLDSGLFHTFDADEQSRDASSLAAVTEEGGILHLLCFSDQGPDTGPHPVSPDELRAAFAPPAGWQVAAIEVDRVHTRFHGADGAPAWHATIART